MSAEARTNVAPTHLMATTLDDLADQLDELSCCVPTTSAGWAAKAQHRQQAVDVVSSLLGLVAQGAAGPTSDAIPRLLSRGLVALGDVYADEGQADQNGPGRPAFRGGCCPNTRCLCARPGLPCGEYAGTDSTRGWCPCCGWNAAAHGWSSTAEPEEDHRV